MYEVYSFALLAWRFILYFAYRLGLRSCPTFRDMYPEGVVAFDRMMGWPRVLRPGGLEHCPKSGPVLFAANHIKKDDPFIMYRTTHHAHQGAYPVRYMMRDDFFASMKKRRMLDIDELAVMAGAMLINREHPKLSQLRPFIQELLDGHGFIMYPSGTRTRSGLFFEYRDDNDEPGGMMFFIAQAQNRRPELRVPAVPMARTYNMITKKSAIILGEPVYLPEGADKHVQRDLDFEMIRRVAALVEVNVSQLVCGLLYLRVLHGLSAVVSKHELVQDAGIALRKVTHPLVDPDAESTLVGQVTATVEFLAASGCVMCSGDEIRIDRERVLSAPPLDTEYVKQNPVKYILNHVIHLADVVSALEHAVLDREPPAV
ncbi:MAG: hypothetical protein AMXMBFR84_21370 [Candidatus Hydrogenedentota bacterium]